jgi:hypothetical protein
MTVESQQQSQGLFTLLEQRNTEWGQWQEKIAVETDTIAKAINDKVVGIIEEYFDAYTTNPVVALPNYTNKNSLVVECSFKDPMSSLFWQCVPMGSDESPSILMQIRNDIPGMPVPLAKKESSVMEEVETHKIIPTVDYTHLDKLLVGISTKASEFIGESLAAYAKEEGNTVFQYDVRVQTGCQSSGPPSFSSSPLVNTSFWLDETKQSTGDGVEKSSRFALLSFFGSKTN